MSANKLKIQGIICARFDDYENRLASGWVQKMIVDELKEEGYVLTTTYFSKCLCVARERKLAKSGSTVSFEKKKKKPDSATEPVIKTPVSPKKDTGKFELKMLSDEEMF